jgi:hypothetical protein
MGHLSRPSRIAPSSFRIPLTMEAGGVICLDDLDLAFLLHHGGGGLPVLGQLAARNNKGDSLRVQWLARPDSSLVPGQKRGTLLVDPGQKNRGEGTIHLVVKTGSVRDKPDDQKPPAEKDAKGVALRETPQAVEISGEGKPFVTYRYNTKDPELPRPYFHPLIGPTGQTITQLGEVAGKREKHFHHTALWIAHQNFTAKGENPCDNWQIGRPNSSRIEHVRFDSVQSGPLAGRFIERLRWLNVKGDRSLLEETRTVTIPRMPPERRLIDVDIRLRALEAPVTLNRTPYHILAVRVLDAMLPGKGGVITNSAGLQNPKDGAAANWIDISGRLSDAWQGVALFNHPSNLRDPTPCLQFASQTIGLAPTHLQAYTIEPNQELRLRYRVFVHAGNVADARVAAEYQAYIKPAQTRIGGPERIIG